MWMSNALGGVLLLICGAITRFAKAGYLIAGYNTMSKQEKAKYNEEALTKFVGNMLMVAAATLLLPLVALLFVDDLTTSLFVVSWVLFTVVIIGGLIYANTGNRFRKK
jgi:undecaprenyl pyrophosphate phosphatase UppP